MDEQHLKNILSKLKAPEPSKTSQDQAIREALRVFEKNIQGNRKTIRLTDVTTFVNNIGRSIMQQRYILSGTVSAVALVTVLGLSFIGEQTQLIAPFKKAAKQDVSVMGTKTEAVQTPPVLPAPSPAPVAPEAMYEMKSMDSSPDAAAMYDMRSAIDMSQQYSAGGSYNMMASMPTEMEAMPIAPPDMLGQPYYRDVGRDKFQDFDENTVKQSATEPVSTFSIDVDTASYSFVRRMLNQGVLPQKDSIRVEEMINYFDYNYAVPAADEEPFKPTVAVYDAPWAKDHKLIHIGIKGYEIKEKPKSNLVFLIDTSGSMESPDKLPLLINSLKMSLDALSPDDTVGIVVYAGSAGTVLDPTKVSEKQKIIAALENLRAGGSTAGAEGIRQAYALAEQAKIKDGNNRIILATDGDFNVGITNPEELQDFVERKRDQGIGLSVLGFGEGNYNDAMMQTLAQNGNGNAAYIDNLNEARKVLVDEASSTLFTIAKDVKIQVEFNPQLVQEYRLIGYETRRLNREDFNNDKVDAGEVGAGHAVTAIYEITPKGVKPAVDDLRYGEKTTVNEPSAGNNEYAFLKIRYKKPDSDTSALITRPITAQDEQKWNQLSDDIRFANAVAGFGQLLKGSKFAGSLNYDQVIDIANNAKGKDNFGYRAEFINLVRLAKTATSLEPQQ